MAETAGERGDASSERRRARSLGRGPGRRAWCGGWERTGKNSSPRTRGETGKSKRRAASLTQCVDYILRPRSEHQGDALHK